MLLREIIAIYSENHKKLVCALCGQGSELIMKASGRYTYHWALKGKYVQAV
jgi:hypothetical protein